MSEEKKKRLASEDVREAKKGRDLVRPFTSPLEKGQVKAAFLAARLTARASNVEDRTAILAEREQLREDIASLHCDFRAATAGNEALSHVHDVELAISRLLASLQTPN